MPAPAIAKPGRVTTIGRIQFESIVPEKLRDDLDPDAPLDNGAIRKVLQRVAEEAPESYRDVSHALLKLGDRGAVQTSSSFTLDDLKSPYDKTRMLAEVEKQELSIFNNPKLDPKARENELVKLYDRMGRENPEISYREALAQGSGLAKMVASGARGNKGQLNSSIGSDWLILDSQDKPVPVPIKGNYAEGLDPAEYFAQSYGTRSGLVSVKFATRDSGFASKQLASADGDIVITTDDCGTTRGIPVDAEDRDSVGSLLSRPIGDIPAGTPLTGKLLGRIRGGGTKKFTVRSPMTCEAETGICAACAGIREKGILPGRMENVGLAASSALGEPLSQGALSKKHQGGVASSQKKIGGFAAINALLQIPKVFPDGATVAEQDGVITKMEQAPQGGQFIWVNDEKHYVPAERVPLVKPGAKIEAGDALSDGVVSPADVVRHKGVGEGRMYWVNAMRQAFKENGLSVSRRNLEVLSRGVVNHAQIEDPEGLGDYLPDDIVEYGALERSYKPAADTKRLPIAKATGQYLQKPILHFSVGTRITPAIGKTLEELDEKEIDVSPTTPPFKPKMIRLMENPSYKGYDGKQDWMTQLSASYVKDNLVANTLSGKGSSDIHGPSAFPGMAYGVEFGRGPKDKTKAGY